MFSILTGEPSEARKNHKINKEPRPPDLPKSSAYAQKGVVFQPYKSTCPQLLTDINGLVNAGLYQIRKEGQEDVPEARLSVYQEAFQRFIDDFNIYRPFLESVKVQYESVIDDLQNRLESALSIPGDIAENNEEHTITVKELEQKCASQIRELEKEKRLLMEQLSNKEKDKHDIELDTVLIGIRNEKIQQELDESKRMISILTKALQGLEEEKRMHDVNEITHAANSLSLQSSIQKSHDELESLLQEKADLLDLQASMVSNESIEKHLDTIEGCKVDMRRLELSHRQLVQRYSKLKAAIDTAFRQHVVIPTRAIEDIEVYPLLNPVPPITIIDSKSKPSSRKALIAATPTLKKKFRAQNQKPIPTESTSVVAAVPNLSELRAQIQQKIAQETDIEIPGHLNVESPDRDPIATLNELLKKGGDPKALIEGLLDQIEKSKQLLNQSASNNSAASMHASLSLLKASGEAHAVEDGKRTLKKLRSVAFLRLFSNDCIPVNIYCADGARSLVAHIESDEERTVLSPWGHFNALGTDSSVPSYLRSSNKIQNLFLSCWNTITFVREISDKILAAPTTTDPLAPPFSIFVPSSLRHKEHVEIDKAPFVEYFELFLKERFITSQRVTEVSYNLLDALEKYSFDSSCRIFLSVLNGQISEDIWSDQKIVLGEILREMDSEDRLKGPMVTNTPASIASAKIERRKISTKNFMMALRRALRTKSEHSFNKLEKAVILQVRANRGVDYESILGVSEAPIAKAVGGSKVVIKARNLLDDSGSDLKKRSPFLELLYLQHFSECLEYTNYVLFCIDKVYDTHAAALAQAKLQAILDQTAVASTTSTKYSSKAIMSTNSEINVELMPSKSYDLGPAADEVEILSLPLGLVRQAIITSDENKTRNEVNRLLSYFCKLTIEEMLLLEARRTPFPIDDIKRRVRMRILKKSPPTS